MSYLEIEQALYRGPGPGGYTLVARSPGFRDDWLPGAERLCDGFGERPTGLACPACVFAQPFSRRRVAVVQVADQPRGELGFYILVVHSLIYDLGTGGDPFRLADEHPPPWQATDPLAELSWPDGKVMLPRTVAQVQRVLQRADGPTLLGGAQVLVDGGRLVFERPAPDTALLRDLWTLLPTSTRDELWPASFAFANSLGFHVVVVPHAPAEAFTGYVHENQAGDYPEGRYEFAVQAAAEAGDQRELDQLFARRNRIETFRLGTLILAVSVVVLFALYLLKPPVEKPAGKEPPIKVQQPK